MNAAIHGGRYAPGRILWLGACTLLVAGVAHADPPVQQIHEISVIAVAPLPGFEVPPAQIPLNVQSAQADDIDHQLGQSLTQLLERSFQGVNVTQSQGNPWQGNLYFHGFTLSPMLGSPSGISVYVDGVRQNEPFAETMNWDFIPDFAIRNVELVPSSNPLYGLNTLAGALLLSTKSGFSAPGAVLHLSAGSWGRVQGDASFGVHDRRFGLFAGIASDYESGWRDFSSSRVRQAFVRGDWRPDAFTRITLSYTGAHNRLHGTQALPVEWADTPAAAYTWPDGFTNHLGLFNLQASRQLNPDWSLQAVGYLRISQSRSFNSNTNDFGTYSPVDGPLGYAVDGALDPASIGSFYVSGVSPAYDPAHPTATINNVPGSNVLGNVHTRGYGWSVQAVDGASLWDHDNLLTLGLSLDVGESAFSQYAQPAYFPLDPALRGDAIGLAPFGPAPTTWAGTTTRSIGVYVMDVLALSGNVHLSAGGRFDRSRLSVSDRSGAHPDIAGRQSFRRFSPSVGVTWAVRKGLGVYLNYDEGMRTPTPIEFECADPNAPCALPNDFTGDPPLKPVVVHTLSAGLRGQARDGYLHWNLSPYYSRVDDDILTIFTGGSSQGYFANVPRTVRKGVDAGIGGQSGALEWQFNYSYVRATYGSAFEVQSAANSSADASGAIHVRAGDRMPGVPEHLFNASVEYHLGPRWSTGADVRAYGSQYAVGDENNRDRHGAIPGYAVLDLDLHVKLSARLTLSARVDNVFDRRYAVSGLLSDNVFTAPGRLLDPTSEGRSTLFIAPGAPRALFVGARYALGGSGE